MILDWHLDTCPTLHLLSLCYKSSGFLFCLLVAWYHARATASVIELEFVVAQYAVVKKAAQTTLQTRDLISMFQVLNCLVTYHPIAAEYNL